jgi:perosamine synthetase
MLLLSAPNIAGNEWKYVKECLDTGWISSVGAYVTQFEQMVADFAGAKYGVATMNGTAALQIALQLTGVERGDYVIVPNITFIASVNAIKYTGADPILMDVDPHSWQMDLDLLERFLENDTTQNDGVLRLKADGRRIRAIMPVHVLGNMCDMARLSQLADRYGLAMVEDSTEALGSYYRGQHAGSFGRMGTFSFNGNKIISTGGGGVIVTDDEALARRAKHLTTQAKADPMEYYHDEVGYNFRLVNILAAVGVAQMEQLPGFIARKKTMDAYYRQELAGVGDIAFQAVRDDVDPNCWLFTFQSSRQREILHELNAAQAQSRPFWVPMNQLPMFRHDRYIHDGDQSASVYQTALSIPSSTFLSDGDLEQVVRIIKKVFA